ncbi:Plant Cell Wall Expansin [Abortiporus biennis]
MLPFSLFSVLCALSSLLTLCFAVPIAPSGILQKRNTHRGILQKRNTHHGKGTYYEVGKGACGQTNSDNDSVLAISQKIWNGGEHCNQWIHIVDSQNGNSIDAQVVDECEGCGPDDLDLSPSVFSKLSGAGLDPGVIQIDWTFHSKN